MTMAETTAHALGGAVRSSGGWVARCPCPGHGRGRGDRTPSLSIRDGDDNRLLVHCHAGCGQDDVIDALRDRGLWISPDNRQDGLAQVAKAAKVLEVAQLSQLAQRTDTAKQALEIWRAASHATGTLVETYLRARGYDGPIPPTLRFSPDLRHPDGSHHPAMIAAVARVPDRKVVAIHRTFLSADGSGKADIKPAKASLGPIGHGAVRLAAAGEQIAVSEGIETGLAILMATGIPTWSALSEGGIKRLDLPPLPLASEVWIGADNDPVGIGAAKAAAERWVQEGRRVRIALPPEGDDFADLLVGQPGDLADHHHGNDGDLADHHQHGLQEAVA